MIELWNNLYSHMQQITFIIALAGFLMSFGQLLHSIWTKRMHFSVEIQNLAITEFKDRNDYTFLLTINNLSSNPLVITKILLNGKTGFTQCYLTHKWNGEHYYPKFAETDIPRTERILTVDFPIQLDANQSFMGYVSFPMKKSDSIPENPDQVTFKFITNKRPKTFALSCPTDSGDSLSV